MAGLFGGGNQDTVTISGNNPNGLTPEMFIDQGYCPPIQIRPGTEALIVYEKGHENDPQFARYQGSLVQTARECHTINGNTLTIKVGVVGRLTAGPKGAAGNYTLPLRVAVVKQNGGKVFYSEIQKVPVTISAPSFNADYTTVVDTSFEISREDRDLIIYIGYDEGKPRAPATG